MYPGLITNSGPYDTGRSFAAWINNKIALYFGGE